MRCKACNTVWLVAGPGASSAPAAQVSVAPASAAPPVIDDETKELAQQQPRPSAALPAPSASPVAAIVKKGAEREKRDLFAKREPDLGVVQTIPPPDPKVSLIPNGVGARNETSVLFRLDQLTAGRARPAAEPERSAAPAERAPERADDEGVIDLKALASVAPAPRSFAPVAPLFSEPPPMTLEVDDGRASIPSQPRRSKLRSIALLAAAVAVLGATGFGISVAFKSEEPVKREAPVAAAALPPPAVVTPPPPAAEPPPAAATNDDKDAKGKKGRRGKGKAAQNGSATTTKGAAAAPAPAKPVKAADPCGCHGDLNCILACTVKGGG